jgi:hypothetical protein
MGEVLPFRQRKPEWFKVPAPGSARFRELNNLIEDQGLTPSARRRRARTSASAGSVAPPPS